MMALFALKLLKVRAIAPMNKVKDVRIVEREMSVF